MALWPAQAKRYDVVTTRKQGAVARTVSRPPLAPIKTMIVGKQINMTIRVWVITVFLMIGLVGCSAATQSLPTVVPTADVSGLAQDMEHMMTGMQGVMAGMQATPMSPEMMAQMQAMMAGMQGMMEQMQGMKHMPGTANMPDMMRNMQGMMGQMQGMMAQMHPAETPMPDMPGMGAGMMADAPVIPAGVAYAEGETIRFIHTEVSDPDIARLLTDMMDSAVLVVPSLADAPDSALAVVYVFTNGPVGMGPLGFQPDVFDNPPGTPGYTPLRRIHLVTWADTATAVELKSAADVQAAIAAGQLIEETPGAVVNMPFVTWADGQR